MLVYASTFGIAPAVALEDVAAAVGMWLEGRSPFRGTGRDLLNFRERRFRDGSRLAAAHAVGAGEELWALRFSHGDRAVRGRRWVVDIGARRSAPDRSLECTVLLQTEEISARVNAEIVASRPGVVVAIAENCGLASRTPGQRLHTLTEENAEAFSYGLESPQRRHPYVIVSPDPDGHYLVDPEKLRSLLIGLADVVLVAPEVDTFWLSRAIGKRYAAWRGAVNIVFAPTRHDGGYFVETRRLTADDVRAHRTETRSPESELLSIVTHRTNLPNSWRALRIERVEQAAFRQEMQAKLLSAKASGDQTEYVQLLEAENGALARQVAEQLDRLDVLNREIETRIDTERRLRWELEQARRSADDNDYETPVLAPTVTLPRDLASAIATGSPSLEQSLRYITAVYPDRVAVLPTATRAAERSDGFQHRDKAFGLLWRLVTDYWHALSTGKGDTEARAVFGSAYAAKESERAESHPAARKRRTFMYQGKPVLMWRHLKIGVKEDSLTETLRIHFHWDANGRRIVIGHCGAHLDFD